ncbi:uncharacterized protein LOC18444270 isoform X2 [Amborella trichopoda]|uniref:uncharacterized protein LOC18444270 isoform X2 n=1 Tax=Amborella trichopoda TaxID=13333 RepID=UPI0009BDB39C|nr:uncharacterized protein LOC18444270 isoform X2 [Amborella trichopoda]|eukprot:XP_020529298.1 uncharacterized protein LOC18444270 isoform X2 [Amborella trichopoda]
MELQYLHHPQYSYYIHKRSTKSLTCFSVRLSKPRKLELGFESKFPSIKCTYYKSIGGACKLVEISRVNSRIKRLGVRVKDEVKGETNLSSEKEGTIIGAVSLIVGSTIGSGILAVPAKTATAGFIPSAVTMILCWGFLLLEALILVEVNVYLFKKKRGMVLQSNPGLEMISFQTMAEETLGKFGGVFASANYVFFAYAALVAFAAKSGELLSRLTNLPSSVSGIIFMAIFSLLIAVGGTKLTDQANQWLTAIMIGLLILIEVSVASFGGWTGVSGNGDWGKIPQAIPVIIFALSFLDLTPVVCAYFDWDISRIRTSLILGSFVPLLVLLLWDAIALGLPSDVAGSDPLDLLLRINGHGVSLMVEVFSLLAIGTSLIGTLLGFFGFLLEQLNNTALKSVSQMHPACQNFTLPSETGDVKDLSLTESYEGKGRFRFLVMLLAVVPPLFISNTIADAFFSATDIAGGFCLEMLFGILPPAMAWKMMDVDEEESRMKIILPGVGFIACGVIIDELVLQWSLHHL